MGGRPAVTRSRLEGQLAVLQDLNQGWDGVGVGLDDVAADVGRQTLADMDDPANAPSHVVD